MDLLFGVLNSDETTIKNSLWKNHEEVHRRLLLLPEERKTYIKELKRVESEIMSIFEKPYQDITKKDFEKADKSAMDFENQAVSKYKNQPFNYSVFSPYNWFWKKMNKLDGFKI